jgi:2-(1,2-epoxy-1,2-dihydrophenyl)acetyl-CoA isomerase
MGLINKAVPADQLDSAVKAYAEHFATAPTKAIGLIKRMLQKSASATLDETLEYEAWCQEIAGSSADYREGVAAFLEKRKARFAGN